MFYKKIKTVLDLIAAKLKTNVKESEIIDIQKKIDTVLVPLQAIKDTFEPVINKIKAQMAKEKMVQSSKSKSPVPNRQPPPKIPVMPITPSSNQSNDRLRGQTPVRRPSIEKSKSITKISPVVAKVSPMKTQPPKDNSWKSENVTENQLKQRYFTRKEKALAMIEEYKRKIFELKKTKFENKIII